jgi:catechol 2,3-dioxygenase-like lactoylglutathione lyase family enzyme
VDVVRALLDAGGDVHGEGDAHELGVIGWATCFGPRVPKDVVALLLERGARHHIFSAIACSDLEAIRQVVASDPDALSRRLSRTENRQTALHYVIAAPDGLLGGGFRTGSHYGMLDLLIELGADLEAMDDKGRTPLALAMLRGDEQAMHRLKAAGALEPAPPRGSRHDTPMSTLAGSITRVNAMIRVPNVREAVEWYRALGFELDGAHEIDTDAAWAGMSFGGAYIMFVPKGTSDSGREVSFWFVTDRIDDLYDVLKQRQLERARSVLSGSVPEVPETRFTGDIHDTFYGQREFSIVDLNGYELNFAQPLKQ